MKTSCHIDRVETGQPSFISFYFRVRVIVFAFAFKETTKRGHVSRDAPNFIQILAGLGARRKLEPERTTRHVERIDLMRKEESLDVVAIPVLVGGRPLHAEGTVSSDNGLNQELEVCEELDESRLKLLLSPFEGRATFV